MTQRFYATIYQSWVPLSQSPNLAGTKKYSFQNKKKKIDAWLNPKNFYLKFHIHRLCHLSFISRKSAGHTQSFFPRALWNWKVMKIREEMRCSPS